MQWLHRSGLWGRHVYCLCTFGISWRLIICTEQLNITKISQVYQHLRPKHRDYHLNPHHHPFHLLLSGQGAGPVAEEDEVQWEQRGTQTVLRYQGTVNSGQQITIVKTKEWKYCTVARLRKIPLFCTKVAKKIIFCRVR